MRLLYPFLYRIKGWNEFRSDAALINLSREAIKGDLRS